MGKKKRQSSRRKSALIPPVGNGGVQKRRSGHRSAPSFVVPGYSVNPQPAPFQIPGFPILNFPAVLAPGPNVSSTLIPPPVPFPLFPLPVRPPPLIPPPSSLLNQQIPLSSLPSLPFIFPPPSFPTSNVIIPNIPPPGVINSPKLSKVNPAKSPRARKKAPINVMNHSKCAVAPTKEGESMKKTQLKYAKQLAARSNKRTLMIAPIPIVKADPDEPSFNLFMNIAQRYRIVQKSPDAIDVQDDTEEDDDVVEEIEREENGNGATAPNLTMIDDMSICTVDEVGEQTMPPVDGKIHISEEEDDDDEILCLGEHKTTHVLSEIIICDDDVETSESLAMNTAFTEKKSISDSIGNLSLDEEDNGKKDKAVSSYPELPDFIPLVDGKTKKNNGKGQQSTAFALQGQQVRAEEEKNGGMQLQNGSSSHWSGIHPLVYLNRTKSAKEKKREMYRKKAENRAISLGSSPATVARAIASSTNTFGNPFTPSKIPRPKCVPPLTPLAHLHSCPPGSSPILPPPSSSSMGLIQSRGLTTSAPQSQPANFGNYGMGSTNPPTLAAVLQDERTGVVRDALTANGIFTRRWEEKWMETDSFSSPPVKVDPSAAPFRICSYNLLCQKTIGATQYLYKHTKFQPHVLEWSHRWPLIQKELRELNADVFGVQEIQDVHWEEFYEPYMKSLGYACFFQPKSESIHSDGLGVFVRTSRFKIPSIQTIDFRFPGTLMDKGNVAQLLRVQCNVTGASLIITNTHILFNEKRGDIKLGQIALLMANIHAIRQEDEPVICLGDWNLEPNSDLYHYITKGSLDANRFIPRYGSGQIREGQNFSYQPMRELPMDTHLKTKMSRNAVLYNTEDSLLQSLQRSSPSLFTHQIPLTSTYAPYGERHVSTFHKDSANPDFIFYSTAGRGEVESDRLRLIRRLAVPPEAGIRSHLEPWPNHNVPSDHIPLLAEFYLSK